MVRKEVKELVELGQFPASGEVVNIVIRQQEALLTRICPPINDEEARLLVALFGVDDYFGLAWTLLHLVESAPGWPLPECLAMESNEWVKRLRSRLLSKDNIDRTW